MNTNTNWLILQIYDRNGLFGFVLSKNIAYFGQNLIPFNMVNKVILIGNVGADPDVRYLEGGVAVANFRLATSEVYNNRNGEQVRQTEWHNIVLWRNLAQIAEKYVKKGMMLYIEGRLRTRSWDDQNGVKRYVTEIYGDAMQMLSRKQDMQDRPQDSAAPQGPTMAQSSPAVGGMPDDSDDLPF